MSIWSVCVDEELRWSRHNCWIISNDTPNGPDMIDEDNSNCNDKWLSWPNTDDRSDMDRWKHILLMQCNLR